MSELARINGWTGFDGIGNKVPGGWEFDCDGMSSLMGCPEDVTVSRRWTTVGTKKSGWLVTYGLDDGGADDLDVVLTFGPQCAAVVRAQRDRTSPESEGSGDE